ncbi:MULTISPECIES: DUF4189 domain-containing protein [unclassified Nocardia]|uniref:DUF4189 domain-containing protein n=1 Tax=unclassified Nocardia TaxID=2637762 RepID=UPI0035E3709E
MKFIGKAVVAVAAVGLAGGTVIGAGTANAAGLHGAIAFSVENWSYGSSVNASSREQAMDLALANCSEGGRPGCFIVEAWSNGCGALVYRNDPAVYDGTAQYAAGSGSGRDRASALRAAYDSLARHYPRAMLANVGSADLSATAVSVLFCTANAR